MRPQLAISLLALLLAAGCIEDAKPKQDEGADAAPVPDAGLTPDTGLTPDAAPTAPTPDAAPAPDAAPPPPACGNEDDLAPNQRADAATPIQPGFSRDDLFLCPESEDWFALDLAEGQTVTVALLADPPQTDLDLEILDAAGAQVAQSAGDTGEETLPFTAPAAAAYLIHVTGYQDEAAFYGLSILSTCHADADCPGAQICDRFRSQCVAYDGPAECGADANEPNDLDSEATGITPPTTVNGTLCRADHDWFAFTTEAGDSVEILLAFPADEDLDMFVVDASTGRTMAAATGDARFNPERLSLSFLPAGRYLVGVTFFLPENERDRSVDYRLELAGRSGQCVIDRDCLNDRAPVCDGGTCRAVVGGAVPLGGRCGVDEDCAPGADGCYTGHEGGQDNVCTVGCQDDVGCAALGEGAYCQPVGRGSALCVPACATDDDCGGFFACQAGRCELRGECRTDLDCAEGDRCTTTGFGSLCEIAGPAPTCGLDDSEPNNRQAEATPVDAGVALDARLICDTDDDWFRVRVPPERAGWLFAVDATFREGVDIDVYVYDEAGDLVGEATSPDNTDERVELRFVAPGDYLVRVDQFSSDALVDTPYTFSSELVDNHERCTIAGNECGATDPLRAQCDEATGACVALQGGGEVPLGGLCDSDDDCGPEAEVCWSFEGGQRGWNICTVGCRGDADCAELEGTTCTPFQGGQFAVCLPPR